MTSPTVLVTGASGFIGKVVCSRLLELGYSLRAATSDSGKINTLNADLTEILGASESGDSCETFAGVAAQIASAVFIPSPLGSPGSWERACEGVDIIIHLAGRAHVLRELANDSLTMFREANRDTTAALATSAVRAGVRRVVYVSSIGVNGGSTDGNPMRETDSPHPHDPYTQSKLEAENSLWDISESSNLEVVIVRPPLVYGPGAKGNFPRLLKLIDLALPLPLLMVSNMRSFIGVENLADALIACSFNPSGVGQVLLVSDGEDWSTKKLIRRIGYHMHRPVRLFPVPVTLLKLAGWMTGQSGTISRLCDSLEIDISRIREHLGWSPPLSTDQGLRKAVAWYVKQTQK